MGCDVGQRRFIKSSGNDFRMKIFIGFQTLTTVVFTVWLLYVWIKGSNFGSQPTCNHLVKYVLFFANVRATATWLRVLFIMYLISTACTLLFRFGAIVSVHIKQLREKIHNKRKKVLSVVSRTEPQERQESHELRGTRDLQAQQQRGSTAEGSQGTMSKYVTPSLG